jgi:2-polyprenyl-3-methyl-5-hydroxy-6-metoxy-1,4-benzoquinol methylase
MKLLNVKLLKSLLIHPKLVASSIISDLFTESISNDLSLVNAYKYLFKAQDIPGDGGFSRGYYFDKREGWDESYIETTGYILETFIHSHLNGNKFASLTRINQAVEFLVCSQNPAGYYTCIDNGFPQAFDTGQVLYGLVAYSKACVYSKEFKLKKEVDECIIKACNWLVKIQDSDGSWTRFGYRGISHSYYSRVASILYESGLIYENCEWKKAAEKFFDWLALNVSDEGAINLLNFEINETGSLSHSMMYVTEGMLHYAQLSGDQRFYNIAVEYFSKITKNIEDTVVIPARFNGNLKPITKEVCITGVAQYANIGCRWFSESDTIMKTVKSSILYLKHRQIKSGPALGGFWGSAPIFGEYASWRAPNWAVKFYIDALEKYKLLNFLEESEYEAWITRSFEANPSTISHGFSPYSLKYMDNLKALLLGGSQLLEIGAGHGRFLRELAKLGFDVIGVDPVIENELVQKGGVQSLRSLRIPRQDYILIAETLQHIPNPISFLNLAAAHLKKGGQIIIFDRNGNALAKVYKFFMQIFGKWMYRWDSPFKEMWYNEKEWLKIINSCGLKIIKRKVIKTGGIRSRYFESRVMMVLESGVS